MVLKTLSLSQGQIARNMVAIWYKYIFSDKNKRNFSIYKEKLLALFLQRYFNSDFKEWEGFVFYVSKSDLLVGKRENFPVCLDWILVEPNLLKIKRGLFHSLEEKKSYRACRKIFKQQVMSEV